MKATRLIPYLAAGLLAAGAAGQAGAATVYDEGVSGDLSNDRDAPTVIAMGAGSNDLLGATGYTGDLSFRDYASFTIPDGHVLQSITVLPGTLPSVAVSFIGIQAGPVVTVDPNLPDPAPLLAWTHYSDLDIGSTILDAPMPLAAGTYSIWIQDFDFGEAAYAFRFEVAAVPEPATAVILGAGILALGAVVRGRSRRIGC